MQGDRRVREPVPIRLVSDESERERLMQVRELVCSRDWHCWIWDGMDGNWKRGFCRHCGIEVEVTTRDHYKYLEDRRPR